MSSVQARSNHGWSWRQWSREETLAALFLYLTLPSKMVDDTSEDVQALAKAIGRTPGAGALKI